MTDIERFNAKTEPCGDCLRWTGRIQPNGYGQFRLNGKTQYAHRASYILFNGALSKCDVVMHSCDNRWCVNPAHLSVGTQRDNLIDMTVKGRHAGITIPNDKIEEIRNDSRSSYAIAREWGVHPTTIQKIKRNINRRYV